MNKTCFSNIPDARAEFQDGTSIDRRQVGKNFIFFHAIQIVGILTEHHRFEAGFILLPVGHHGLADLGFTIKKIDKITRWWKHFHVITRSKITYNCSFYWCVEDPVRRGYMLWNTFSVCERAMSRALDHMAVENHTLRSAQLQTHSHPFILFFVFSRAWRRPFNSQSTNLDGHRQTCPLVLAKDVKNGNCWNLGNYLECRPTKVHSSKVWPHLVLYLFPYRFNFHLEDVKWT